MIIVHMTIAVFRLSPRASGTGCSSIKNFLKKNYLFLLSVFYCYFVKNLHIKSICNISSFLKQHLDLLNH